MRTLKDIRTGVYLGYCYVRFMTKQSWRWLTGQPYDFDWLDGLNDDDLFRENIDHM